MTGLKLQSSNSGKTITYWQQMQSTPKPDQLQKQLSHQSSLSPAGGEDQHLFATPCDLLCPITLGLFQDPVCNAVGQVYERAAIQRHLVQAAINGQPPTDPISNAVLPSLDLVPVFPMRSRAAQYREATARTCVDMAAAPGCPDPVRYLRRAAELLITSADSSSSSNSSNAGSSSGTPRCSNTAAGVQHSPDGASAADSPPANTTSATAAGSGSGGVAFSIPGMSMDFARYLQVHQGSEYNALVLKYFGNELLRSGCADAAADVFNRLLLEADDRVQQAEYLQLCLDCWTSSSSTANPEGNTETSNEPDRTSFSSSGGTSTAAQQQHDDVQQQQPAQEPAGAHFPAIISKLADFVQRQNCLSASAIVRMLQGMNHGHAMALQLCQVLLARAAIAASEAAGSEAVSAVDLPNGLGDVLELLVHLIELGNGQLQEQLQALASQVKVLEAAQQLQVGSSADSSGLQEKDAEAGSVGAAGTAGAAAGSKAAAAQCKGVGGSKGSKRKAVVWRGGKGLDVLLGRAARAAAAGTLAVASLAAGNHPVLRIARVGPLLYLLRAGL